jgi:glycosyltransferase involved in cell wall biosynthesis
MLRKKLEEAAFVVSISEYNRDYLSRTVGEWVREKTHVVHCGIDPGLYTPRGERGTRGERFEILNIGSLQPYKGQPYLVEACARLKQRGVPFHCEIVGGGSQQKLKQLIAQHGLRDEMELLGPLDETQVARRLRSADCYVQPSIVTPSGKMEGIPVSLMEAMAAETPVVASCISGIPELVQDRRTGYLVPPADALSLADAIEVVYRHPQEAGLLAAAGRRLVMKEFDLHTNVSKLGALFQEHHEARSPLLVGRIPYAAHPLG